MYPAMTQAINQKMNCIGFTSFLEGLPWDFVYPLTTSILYTIIVYLSMTLRHLFLEIVYLYISIVYLLFFMHHARRNIIGID